MIFNTNDQNRVKKKDCYASVKCEIWNIIIQDVEKNFTVVQND